MNIIYTLTCPISKKIIYVGKTKTKIHLRLVQHLSCEHNLKKKTWIFYLISQGLVPIIEEIDRCVDDKDSYRLERYWIHQIKAWGFDLINIKGISNKIIKKQHMIYKETAINNLIINKNDNIKNIFYSYYDIVTKLIQFRNDSGQTQDDVAKWLGVTRKKIIEFETFQRFDVELLCIYCDKFDVDLKLTFEIH